MRGRIYADNCFGYPYKQNDGGRSTAVKKLRGDCGAIALAIATGKPYDVCREALQDSALLTNSGCFMECFVHSLEFEETTFHGMTFERISFPAVKGKIRMRCEEFTKSYPTGRFIIQVSRHYIACVDGVIMGEYPVQPTRCIYVAWEVINS